MASCPFCYARLFVMRKRGTARINRRVAMWAVLTVISFPIVSLSMSWLGADPFISFLLGAAASLLVLLLEGAVRGRWWISEPAVTVILGDSAFGLRLLILSGIVVLLFQSFVLTGFVTNGAFDGNVVNFILRRECAPPTNALFIRLCRAAEIPTAGLDTDLSGAAVREAAEKRFFAGGLITCAERPLAIKFGPQTFVRGSFVRCDRWVISRIAGRPISVQTVKRPVIARLAVRADGTYRVDGWSDDASSPDWTAVGGSIADLTLNQARAKSLDVKLDDQMATETLRRVMEKITER